jgi:hypothetical protein
MATTTRCLTTVLRLFVDYQNADYQNADSQNADSQNVNF